MLDYVLQTQFGKTQHIAVIARHKLQKLSKDMQYDTANWFRKVCSSLSALLFPKQGGMWQIHSCRKANGYINYNIMTTRQAGSDLFLFSLGLDIYGKSINRNSSPTSQTNIRYNFTSRHNQKKKERRASLGWPSSPDECLFSLL